MRKIEEAMRYAVRMRKNWVSGNTRVEVYDSEVKVFLHGNMIYRENRMTGEKRFTLAGWPTRTTRSRLWALGIHITQNDWTQYYNGEPISSREWYAI